MPNMHRIFITYYSHKLNTDNIELFIYIIHRFNIENKDSWYNKQNLFKTKDLICKIENTVKNINNNTSNSNNTSFNVSKMFKEIKNKRRNSFNTERVY